MTKRNLGKWYRHGNWWKRLWFNRKYKDVLFRHLFRDKRDLLDLYNALNGSTYRNPNMPLRGLLYFAQQFEGLLAARGDDIYGKGRIELPTPIYIVFYNGSGMNTDNLMLYLSDSFSAGRGNGCLECTCEVININRGYNQDLMGKCHRLWEYSELSSEVEENIRKGMRREEAVHTAIDSCIERGILTDILLTEKGVVLHMLLTEYDEKKHLRNTFREGREAGEKIGREMGRREKLKEMVEKKLARGKTVLEIAEELEEEIPVIEEMVSGLTADYHTCHRNL